MYIYVFFQAYAMFPLNKATAFDVLNFRDLNIDVAFVWWTHACWKYNKYHERHLAPRNVNLFQQLLSIVAEFFIHLFILQVGSV